VRAFLDGAGPAATGAIAGAAVPLAHALTLSESWQLAIFATATPLALFVGQRGLPRPGHIHTRGAALPGDETTGEPGTASFNASAVQGTSDGVFYAWTPEVPGATITAPR
jgi:hypothetical protein